FALLTTDGYWNDSGTVAIDTSSNAVNNQDNVPNTSSPFYVSRPTVTLDGMGTQTQEVTPRTVLEQAICTGNASVLGGSNNCGCTGSFKRVKQRTQIQQATTNKTDGVVTSGPNITTSSTSFQDITACDLQVNTTVTRVRETERVICQGTGTANFSGTPDTSCGCTGSNRRIKQRVRDLDRTVITTDGIPGTPTYANPGASAFSDASICITGTPTISGPNPAYATLSTISNTTTGSQITNANITITPNPTTTSGTTTTTVTALGGSGNTLADVAMYYYKTDLRTGAPLSKSDNSTVPTTDKDIAKHQHMVTFSLGLGLQGLMDYVPDYESDPTSDYSKIKNADTSCAWTAGTCNWPIPSASSPTTLDDLWHAAVNGRGSFYSAADPNTLADGLSGALSALKVQTAAAAASATSSPNITETDNFIYSSTFRTVKWDGEITAQRIDTSSGNILPGIVWSAQGQLDAKVGTAEALTPPGDGRNIWTHDPAAANKLKPFKWANLTSAEKAYFENKCTALSQCPLLTAAQQTDANNGDNMVNFLRGRTTHEATIYRDREHVLGDPVNATPAFVQAPRFAFNDAPPSYELFKAAQASRQGVLYIAANDGMLHAFNGDTGNEMWAYVPRIVFPDLHFLATDNWDVRHAYNVDGSPQIMDVYDSGAGAWKTILVAGLGGGGRGYYALDVTNPASPKGMWEVCQDPAICVEKDDNIGYSFGPPIITKDPKDDKWVVMITSGYNNVSPGDGKGYIYIVEALTGTILDKKDTGVGDTTTPSGLSKISAYANSFNTDNTSLFVYGGDLFGNLWRFDVEDRSFLRMAELKDGSGKPQSITTRPELGFVDGYRVVYVGTGRYLGEDDLVDPATLTPALPWAYQQSFYAIKDRNVALGNIRTSTPGLQQQTITILSLDSRSTTTNVVDWATKDGWYVDFNPSSASPGERVNLDPVLALGTLVVVTNVPSNSACVVGGDAWIYQFDYKDGTYVATATGEQAGQRFTGQTLVGVVVVRLPSGVLKGIATGATGTKTTVGVNIGGSGSVGRRVSWRELLE
ncbi:MAG: pilus assembly protein, partial [Betaproteobacteria bacterium]